MKRSISRLAELSLLIILGGPLLSGAVGIMPTTPPGNCVLKVRVSQSIASQFYKQSLEYYRDLAMDARILSVPIEQIRPSRSGLTSGIVALDNLVQLSNLGGGAEVEPLVPDWYFNLLEPELRAFILRDMATLVVKFHSSPATLNQDGSVACDSNLVTNYKSALRGLPEVESIAQSSAIMLAGETMMPTKRSAPNDQGFIDQWGLDCSGRTQQVDGIDFTCVPDSDIRYLVGPRVEGSNEVYIFHIDTGIWAKHPDFDSNRIKTELGINVVDASNPTYLGDDNGHGTHTAGNGLQIVDNRIFGAGAVSNKVYAVPVKMFGLNAFTSDQTAVMAVLWPANTKLKLKKQGKEILAAISASWITLDPSPDDLRELRAAVLLNLKMGIPFINAAGNGANNNDGDSGVYPALWARDPEFEEAADNGGAPLIAVAASGPDGGLTSFSGEGEFSTAIAAPGIYDCSTVPPGLGNPDGAQQGNPDLRACWKGTSMATPKVSYLGIGDLASIEGKSAMEGQKGLRNLSYRVKASGAKNIKMAGHVAGGLLNLYELKVSDNRLPQKPDNIQISNVTFDSAEISFIVPSDFANDGLFRNLGLYDFRFMIGQEINDGNFWYGKRLKVPWPKYSGEKEKIITKKLPSDSQIFLAARFVDKGGNYVTSYLPPFRTNPVNTTWIESTDNFLQNLWQFQKVMSLPNLWHFQDGDLVYKVPGGRNYDTSDPKFGGVAANGGLSLTAELTLPQDPVLSLKASISTGVYNFSIDGRSRTFEGDDLIVFVYPRGQTQGIEVARLHGDVAALEEKIIPLAGFSGKNVKIGFFFQVSQESVQKEYPKTQAGIVIKSFEIYGTRTDFDNLPLVRNSGFRRGHGFGVSDWAEWLYCDKCERSYSRPDDYYIVNQFNDQGPDGLSLARALKLWNGTLNPQSYLIVDSPIALAKAFTPYELSQQIKFNGQTELVVAVHYLDRSGVELTESGQLIKENSDSWKKITIPFIAPPNAEKVRVSYALRGQTGRAVSINVTDFKINFRSKTFSAE